MSKESITAKILTLNKTKEAKLCNLVLCIEQYEHLDCKTWHNLAEIQQMPKQSYCVLVVYEWLRYKNWKGEDIAIYYDFEIFLDQLENQLGLLQVAKIAKKIKEIYESQKESQIKKMKRFGMVSSTPEFDYQCDLFDAQKPLIINTLYEYVEKNIDFLP